MNSTETTFQYPLTFRFKLVSLSPQFWVKDAQGNPIAYTRQKAFKLKEDVTVYRDESRSQEIFKIKADRWIDWSAVYNFTDTEGNKLGKIGRKGTRSLFKAYYEIFDREDQQDLVIQENSFWVRMADGLFGEIPFIGALSGYVFNPKYNVTRADGTLIAQFAKKPSAFGRSFELQQKADFQDGEELRVLLSLMMMVLLERRRG